MLFLIERHALPGAPVVLQDLHVYDPSTTAWTDLSGYGAAPAPRFGHGFSADGGILYTVGGMDVNASESQSLSTTRSLALQSVPFLCPPRRFWMTAFDSLLEGSSEGRMMREGQGLTTATTQ